ncbi:hypothetical protein [Flavobacterium tagetis]|nr:hypothetical protein [Flavobacterium tagetis]
MSLKKRNGTNSLQLAPFGFVTGTGQITASFLDDLKKLAFYM